MGQGQSSSTEIAKAGRRVISPSRLRYAILTAPNGVKVHLVGVYPCSTLSEDEAFSVVATVQPAALYIDVHPEILIALQKDVEAGRVNNYIPSALSMRYTRFEGAGWVSSIKIRQMLADNEMLKLIGAEMFGAYKTALAASKLQASPPKLLSFPLKMDHNNGENMDRPGHVLANLMGNAQMNSDTVFATLGSQIKILTTPNGDLTFPVQIPKTMFFTRAQVTALQEKFRESVNALVRIGSAESMDTEAEIAKLEQTARANDDAQSAEALLDFSRRAERQAQAIVSHLHTAALQLPPDASMVAIVNLGSMQSLIRNWEEGKPHDELFPPYSWVGKTAAYAAQAAIGGGLAYGWYRAFRRFPKTTAGVTVVAGGAVGMMVYGMIYAETMMYGNNVRAALCSPRIPSAIARVNSK